jgi:hypothetical protein
LGDSCQGRAETFTLFSFSLRSGVEQKRATMRAEKNNPTQRYNSYYEWLVNGHQVWILSLFFGYLYYFMTTDEV